MIAEYLVPAQIFASVQAVGVIEVNVQKFGFSPNSIFNLLHEGAKGPLPGQWRAIYWLYAASIPVVLYAFAAIKVLLYHVARAPNVDLITQLAVLLVFYGIWIFIPRLCWALTAKARSNPKSGFSDTVLRLGALGLFLSGVHVFLDTILHLFMNARVAWAWEPVHVVHKYGEIWLESIGLWLMVYVAISAMVLRLQTKDLPGDPPPTRYEVRENGKSLSIPFADIYWIKAAGNYVELRTVRGAMMVRKTLAQISDDFSAGGFLKSHRGALINGRHVLAIKLRDDSSSFVVQLTNGDEAPLSRRNLSVFKKTLKTVP